MFVCLYVFSLTARLFTYSSVRKLVKLSAVQFMLNNHTVSTSPADGRGFVRPSDIDIYRF